MKTAKVKVYLEVELNVDDDATEDDIEAIIKFETHYTGRLDTHIDYEWVDTDKCHIDDIKL